MPARHPTRAEIRRRAREGSPWWQSPWAMALAGLGVIAILAVALFRPGGDTISGGTPAAALPPAVLSAVASPPAVLLDTVGAGGSISQLTRMPGSQVRHSDDGRILVIYVGAEYCPFCAAERWSVVMALSRFGSFAGLTETTSSSTDVHPDTATVTFHGSIYSSAMVSFDPVELQDRAGAALETPDATAGQVFTGSARPPYTATAQGFPFLDIGGRFVLSRSGVDPAVLHGLSWDQIGAALADTRSPVTVAIAGHANWLTAAICLSDGNRPAAVCATPLIRGLEAHLQAQPLPPTG
jgi:hypothetical protein